jgi:hypothetical protein
MSSPRPPPKASSASRLPPASAAPQTLPRIRQSGWSPEALFATAESDPRPRGLSHALREQLHGSLWHSLSSEYDARHLSAFLRAAGLRLSDAFWALEAAWAEDEQKHYRALRWLYSRVYSVDERELDAQLARRQPDFAALRPLLVDEFSLCVVLAFDELASSRSYARDRVRFRPLGPTVVRLLGHAARDELWHCLNALDLLRALHAQRLSEVPALLSRVIAHDTSPQFRYGATFLLDQLLHPTYGETDAAFLCDCRDRVERYLSLKGP